MPRKPSKSDSLTPYGANALCRQIETYWRERGFFGIRAVSYVLPGTDNICGVRSNIGGNGYPPRRKVAW